MVKNLLVFAAAAALCAPAIAQQESAFVDIAKAGEVASDEILASSDDINLSAGAADTYKGEALAASADKVKSLSINGTAYALGKGLKGSADPKATNKSPDLTLTPTTGAFFKVKATADGYLYLIAKLNGTKDHYVYNSSEDYFVAYSVSVFDASGNQFEFTLPAAEEGSDVFTKLGENANATDEQKNYMNAKKIKALADCHKAANGGTSEWSSSASGVIAFPVKSGDEYLFYGRGTKTAVSGFVFDKGATSLATIAAASSTSLTATPAADLDANAPIYNLLGQRVMKGYKGVCIQNGRKFIVR